MDRIQKKQRRVTIQYASEGDIENLKKLFKEQSDMVNQRWFTSLKKEAFFYTVRKCNVDCAKYFLNDEGFTVNDLRSSGYNSMPWSIMKTKNKQEDRLKMFRFLYDNGMHSIPNNIIVHYALNRKRKYFKMAVKEFSKEYDLNELLENGLNDRVEFVNDIISEMRNEKIDSIVLNKT